MSDTTDKAVQPPQGYHDHELRKLALEHARGAIHKAGDAVLADARLFYEFLTGKSDKTDAPTGPTEHYTGTIGFRALSISRSSLPSAHSRGRNDFVGTVAIRRAARVA